MKENTLSLEGLPSEEEVVSGITRTRARMHAQKQMGFP